MKNNKLKLVMGLSTIALLTTITTGCGKEVNISKKAVVGFENGEITANDYYKDIKVEAISRLVNQIDEKILSEKYKLTKDDKEDIEKQIKSMKEYYPNDTTYKQAIKQYYGAEDDDDVKEVLTLEKYREKAVNKYIEKHLSNSEIKKYYDENVYGDMAAKHILISVDSKDDATEEEQEEAKNKAKEEAEKVIQELEDGKKFDSLAEKYSDDKATASKGGDLGTFAYDDMVKAFSEACYKLEVGQYTKEPIETSYGYHIILKTDQKEKKSLNKVKSEIKEKVREQKLEDDEALYYKTLMKIREENGITWNDSKLKKAYEDYMQDIIDSFNDDES